MVYWRSPDSFALIRTRLLNLEFATQVQLGFLPKSRPNIEGYEFADYSEAAQRVGGDYFDYITFAGKPAMLGVVVADVTGKGVDAGMVMGMTKADIFSLTEQDMSTRDIVLKLNRHLCKLLNRQKFI